MPLSETTVVRALHYPDRTEEYHMTIESILNLPLGETMTFLCFDRNMYDTSTESAINPENQPVRVDHFFRFGYHMLFRRLDGLKGESRLYSHAYEGGDIEWYNDEYKPFEFDIEYDRNCWYPLRNNCLPPRDPQGFGLFDYSEPKHWNTFPISTRVGWRGPLIRIDQNLDDLPLVAWAESDYD